MLELARDRLASFGHILLRRADATFLPFESLSFDTVLLANLLNTVEFPLAILKESFRVLKYDGLLIAIVYTDYGASGEQKTDLALRYFQKFGLPPPWGLHNFSPTNLRSLLAEARFYVRNVTLMGHCPKALYARAFKKLRSD
jgi:ubiquinone/menaquinone biosynthesis C-methylase UbiE